MKNHIEIIFIIGIMLYAGFFTGCRNTAPWMKFIFQNEIVVLKKSDATYVGMTKDAKGNPLVVLILTKEAEKRLSTVTIKHVNTNVDLYFKNKILYKSIPVSEGMNLAEIHMAVDSQDKAEEIVKSWQEKGT